MLKKLLFTALTLALIPVATRVVNAEEYIIVDNGSGSDNELNISSTSTTTVQQNNTADVQNSVDVSANTGDNSANSNTGGDVAIDTGNIDASTSIENNLNSSYVNIENCNTCNTSGQAIISNNGSYSDNVINYTSNNTNTVTVDQYASVNNYVNGYANTGGNTANYNNGDVDIDTGSITVQDVIKNNTNLSKVNLKAGANNSFLLKINGNGAWSENILNLIQNDSNIITVDNVADIYNSSFWDLITGNNEANKNNGNVAIKTGDIDLDVLIENNVNQSEVVVDCGCEEEEKPEEEKPTTPPTGGSNPPITTTTTEVKTTSDTKAGEVLSQALEQILPATGTPWLILAIFGNLLLLLFGMVLRLRSGRSPGLAYAI